MKLLKSIFILSAITILLQSCQSVSPSANWEEIESINKSEQRLKDWETEYINSGSFKRENLDSLNTNIGRISVANYIQNYRQPNFLKNRYRAKTNYIFTNSNDSIYKESSQYCICSLENDTIEIKMPSELFGGEEYNIKLVKLKPMNFEYIENHHQLEAFPIDSIFSNSIDEIRFEIEKYELNFKDQIKAEKGHLITGILKFSTPQYKFNSSFILNQGQDNSTVYRSGEIIFKCNLLEKITILK